MALLLTVHTSNSSPLRSNLLRLKCTWCTVPTPSGRPHGSPLVWACQWLSSQPLSSPQLSYNDGLSAQGITKCHSEQGPDYREAEELSWCPSWSNRMWQGWSCGLGYCPSGNATDSVWRVLASSDGISSWTSLKPQHSNPNLNPKPKPLVKQLWCSDFLTSAAPLIIPHRLPAFLESLMPLRNWCSIHARWFKSSLKHSVSFFSKLKIVFYCISFFLIPDCIFEIHQLWQSGFSWGYSNSCRRCSFEAEIIKIGQSSHKMYSNNIDFSRVYDNLKGPYEKCLEIYRMHLVYMYIYIYVCVCVFRRHFFVEAHLIKYYRYPLSTYSYFDPFKSPYGC